MNRKIIFVVALWMGHHFSIAQQVQIGAHFSPYINLNRGTLGQGAGGEAYWKTTPRLWLGYGFSYLAENDKVRSYGNPIADGVGYEQSLHTHGINGKYYLVKEKPINPYLGLGLLYAKRKYNNKSVHNSSALEVTQNRNIVGLSSTVGFSYKSSSLFIFDAGLKATYIEDSPLLQLTFGLFMPL